MNKFVYKILTRIRADFYEEKENEKVETLTLRTLKTYKSYKSLHVP